MAYGSNNTGMAVVLVGLMLIGSLAFFLFAQTWTSLLRRTPTSTR